MCKIAWKNCFWILTFSILILLFSFLGSIVTIQVINFMSLRLRNSIWFKSQNLISICSSPYDKNSTRFLYQIAVKDFSYCWENQSNGEIFKEQKSMKCTLVFDLIQFCNRKQQTEAFFSRFTVHFSIYNRRLFLKELWLTRKPLNVSAIYAVSSLLKWFEME